MRQRYPSHASPDMRLLGQTVHGPIEVWHTGNPGAAGRKRFSSMAWLPTLEAVG